jgi:small subunit ribosomal protein S3
MTHIVHPYAHRLGVTKDWKSRWFSTGQKYVKSLKGDIILREYIQEKMRGMYVAGVEIERNQKALRIIIQTSRPGMIIGRSGEGSVKLKNDIQKILRKQKLLGTEEIKLDIVEVKSPDANATIVAQMIAEGLEKRMTFRRVMKQTVEKVMASREVKGVKLELSGRLGGADIARTEKMKRGQIPLQTLRADIDYAHEEAHMTYGNIGVKVWIYKGEIFDKKVTA